MKKTPGMRKAERFDWFTDARFGLFIHWGLFALPPGPEEPPLSPDAPGPEANVPLKIYAERARRFNPVKFDADQWVRLAKGAGMRYLCMISKHVEGFSMFDSKVNDYTIVRATPFKRDALKEVADACRRHGLTFCFYYCQALDNRHPDAVGNTWDYPDESKKDFQRFIDGQVKPQLTELLTRYGPVGLIWFDVPVKITKAQSEDLAALVHRLQPDCLISSRIGHNAHDYVSAEDCGIPLGRYDGPWETPMTLNDHWGYWPWDGKWKTPTTIVRNLVDIVSKGGNYLLNVGPSPEGDIPGPSVRVLQEVGRWMDANHASIRGAGPAPLPRQVVYPWGRCTAGGNRLFLHIFDWPLEDALVVPGIRGRVSRAYLLADKRKRRLKLTRVGRDGLRIALPAAALPAAALDAMDTVVALEFRGAVDLDSSARVTRKAATVLPAYEAALHGGVRYADGVWEGCQATSETWAAGADAWAAVPERVRYDRVACVANWRRMSDGVGWGLCVEEAGAYDVELKYAADAAAAGNACTVTIGKKSLAVALEPTGSWYDFKSVKVGRVVFDRPCCRALKVRPRTIRGGMLMNLQSVTLVPAQAGIDKASRAG